MNESLWNEWRDLLMHEFEGRQTALGTKGNRVVAGRKGLTALFLLLKDLGGTAVDILPEAIETMRGKEVKNIDQAGTVRLDEDQCDAIEMMGHRIGILESSDDLKQYLRDVHELTKPNGQMLLSSIDMHTINRPQHMSYQRQDAQSERHLGEIGMQFQYGDLMGPFFGLFHIDAETLKNQAAAAQWQCEIHQQDENNYLALLRHGG